MDEFTKKILILRIANFSLISITQFITPLLLIQRFSAEFYGSYVFLLSVFAFISFLDFGLLQTVGNEMITASDAQKSRMSRLLRAFLLFTTSIVLFLFFGLVLFLYYVLNVRFSWRESLLVISSAVTYLFIRYAERVLQSYLSTFGYSIMLIVSITEFLVLCVAALMQLALVQFLLSIFFIRLISMYLLFSRVSTLPGQIGYFLEKKGIDWPEIRYRIPSGFLVLSFSLGLFVLNDLTIVIVGILLGPNQVASVAVLRLLSSIFRQIVGILTVSFSNQLTRALDTSVLAAKLITRKLLLSGLAISIFLSFCLLFVMDDLIFFMTNQKLEQKLLLAFLLSGLCDVPWIICSAVPLSINQNRKIAIGYIFSSLIYILFLPMCLQFWGIISIPILGLVQDAIMTPICWREMRRVLANPETT